MTGPARPVTPTALETPPAGGDKANGPVLYTVEEVARMFRRTDRTIRNWVRQGLIRPTRVGRSLFFGDAEIERLTSSSQADTDQDPEG